MRRKILITAALGVAIATLLSGALISGVMTLLIDRITLDEAKATVSSIARRAGSIAGLGAVDLLEEVARDAVSLPSIAGIEITVLGITVKVGKTGKWERIEQPIVIGTPPITAGTVAATLDRHAWREAMTIIWMAGLGIAGTITVLCWMVMAWYLDRTLRPLADLSRAVRNISPGEAIGHVALPPGAPKEITDLVEAVQDMSRAVQKAMASSHRKSMEIAAVSHDVRNHMQGLALFLEEAEGLPLPEVSRKDLVAAKRHLVQVKALFSDAIDVARIESGMFIVHPHGVRAKSLVEEAVKEIGLGDVKIMGEDAAAWVDPEKTKRIVGNIVINAERHGGGQVMVETEVRQGFLHVTVTDEGEGMSEQELQELFTPFKGRGSGIGMAIARELAEAMGGKIDVESAPGEGTRVRLSLPAERPRATIAVLTGNEDLRSRLSRILGDLGEISRNPANADLIVIDGEWPGAESFLAGVGHDAPPPPIIAISGDKRWIAMGARSIIPSVEHAMALRRQVRVLLG
ncbi:MAG: sensor histidine kinase [Gammaproteobacteria bacterium]|nr:MAG: sensor histidine kinase [Gammaproteobacteria bacterium]